MHLKVAKNKKKEVHFFRFQGNFFNKTNYDMIPLYYENMAIYL